MGSMLVACSENFPPTAAAAEPSSGLRATSFSLFAILFAVLHRRRCTLGHGWLSCAVWVGRY